MIGLVWRILCRMSRKGILNKRMVQYTYDQVLLLTTIRGLCEMSDIFFKTLNISWKRLVIDATRFVTYIILVSKSKVNSIVF